MYTRLVHMTVIIMSTAYLGLAQDTLNTLYVDQQTYSLYELQQWKSLIKLGKSAKKQDIDFYYLQYRMGISYYELKKYRQAISFFERVVQQSPDEKTAIEYLYYAYLFSGREEDARVLSLTFEPSFRKQLNLSNEVQVFDAVGAEYKYYNFDDYAALNGNTETGLDQKVHESLNYVNVNLKSYNRSKFSLFQTFSYLWGINQVYDPLRIVHEFSENLKQFQYYLSGNWHLGKGGDMTLAFHYLHTTLEGLNPNQRPGPGYHNQKYLYISKSNTYVGFFKLSKSISNVNFRAAATVSNLNGEMQYLPLLGLDYYPMANTNLYFRTDLAYQFAPEVVTYSPGLIFKQKIGVRLLKWAWVEPFLQYGAVSNYADEDAQVIYNSKDVINYWYGVRLNLFAFNYKLNLYYIFQYYQNTNYYNVAGEPGETDYNSATHLVGIKWLLN